MCVAALPVIALAATVISTGIAVKGALDQGKAAKQQANYQAQVSENNAKIATWQAEDARTRGQQEESRQRSQVRQALGQQRASIAGSGFELGDETSMALLGDTAATGELDALTIRQNAAREAWGYETQSTNLLAESQLQRTAGSNALSASKMQAAGSLFEGASKFGTQASANKKSSGSMWKS